MDIEAPRIAKSANPDNLLLLWQMKRRTIPLTICDYDEDKGTVTIIPNLRV